MTICRALAWAKENLKNNINEGGFCKNRLQDFGFGIDAEVLLSYVLKKDKEFLLTYPECKISKPKLLKYKCLINRRAKGVPVAYLTNHKEFFALDFYVDKRVLIPRPETEMLVRETLETLESSDNRKINIVDVGTGSGCIAIAVAHTLGAAFAKTAFNVNIYATDVSKDALAVAKKNAKKHNLNIKFLQGDLLEPLIKKNIFPNIIIANLPYLKPRQIKSDIKYEPRKALAGGKDGLRCYKKLLKQIKEFMIHGSYNPKTFVGAGMRQLALFEIDPRQKKRITELTHKFLPNSKIKIKKDLSGLERMVKIES